MVVHNHAPLVNEAGAVAPPGIVIVVVNAPFAFTVPLFTTFTTTFYY